MDQLSENLILSGLISGSKVILCFRQKELEWIVTLALFKNKCSTGSNHGYLFLNDLTDLDYVITDQAIPYPTASNQIIVNKNLTVTPHLQNKKVSPHHSENFERFFLTSGTTGTPKIVSRPMKSVLDNARIFCTLNPNYSSTLDLMRLSAGGGLNQALSTLVSGSTLYCANNSKLAYELLNQYHIKSLHGSPTQIGNLIKLIHDNQLPRLNLDIVRYTGAQASTKLVRNIQECLSKKIYISYGSTEAGGIAGMFLDDQLGPNFAGYVYPHATVEVLDNNLSIYDQPGILRVKTNHLVNGYKNNPDATDQHFKEGWFYPGDRAILYKNGLLQLLGRENDFINRGGVKIDPAEVDQALNGMHEFEDAAVFPSEDKYGIPILVAAVVYESEINLKALHQKLISLLGNSRVPKYYLKVKEIPRNHMGKVLRKQLKERYDSVISEQLQKSDNGMQEN